MSFTYNDEGIRTSKTVDGVVTTYYLEGSRIIAEETAGNVTVYFYDTAGSVLGMRYLPSGTSTWQIYWFEHNLQGDVVAVYDASGTKLVSYTYDAWGNTVTTQHATSIPTPVQNNPYRYRGYYFDIDLNLYYLNARYYDQVTGRFISADNQLLTGGDLIGTNLFAYCGNNPVNRIDPTGEAWLHWGLGAAIVVGCAIATVITCGGFAAAAGAVVAVGSGVAAATTASTVAAGVFIGSAIAYGSAAFIAATTSESVDDFAEQGNWSTVISTASSAIFYGSYGYFMASSQIPKISKQNSTIGVTRPIEHGAQPNSRYIQIDQATGHIRTDTVYDASGNWYSRIDYMHYHKVNGVPVKPHIHFSAPLNQYGRPIGRKTTLPW